MAICSQLIRIGLWGEVGLYILQSKLQATFTHELRPASPARLKSDEIAFLIQQSIFFYSEIQLARLRFKRPGIVH